MVLEELGKIADGWINEGAKVADSFEKFARGEVEKATAPLGMVGDQLQGLYESFGYDERPAIEGEAKPLHPNMVAGLTPIRWIGVTRLPLLGAKVIQKTTTWLQEARQMVKTSRQVTTKPSPTVTRSIKSFSRGKQAKIIAGATTAYLMSKAPKKLPKIPKKTIPIAGAALVTIWSLTNTTEHGSHNSGEEWMGRKPKDRRERWL